MPMIFWVAAGGAIGASARYLVSVQAGRLFGMNFPWGTMIVNVAGSFAMGALISLLAIKWSAGQDMRAFLTTGILGGFTTFSAFALDFSVLFERKQAGLALAYAGGTLALTLAAVFAGLYVVRVALS